MAKKIIVGTYETPCGRLKLGSSGDRLCLCDWEDVPHSDNVARRLGKMLNAVFADGSSEIIERARIQLDEYFAGERREFSIHLLPTGTEFQRKVWRELLDIPYATTVTYASVAERIGAPNAVRAVAGAIGANAMSIFVPCHRVIGHDGSLTGYAGGIPAKQLLLTLESKALHQSLSDSTT